MAAGGIRISKQVSKTGVMPKTKAADVMYVESTQSEARLHRQQSHARQKNPSSYGQTIGQPRRNTSSVGIRNNRQPSKQRPAHYGNQTKQHR